MEYWTVPWTVTDPDGLIPMTSEHPGAQSMSRSGETGRTIPPRTLGSFIAWDFQTLVREPPPVFESRVTATWPAAVRSRPLTRMNLGAGGAATTAAPSVCVSTTA